MGSAWLNTLPLLRVCLCLHKRSHRSARHFAHQLTRRRETQRAAHVDSQRAAPVKRDFVAVVTPDFDLAQVVSNEFELEWSPRSGRIARFPELDDARWVGLDEARRLLVAGQQPILTALAAMRTS